MALSDDLVTDRGIKRPVHVVQQQRPGVAVAEPVDRQLWEPGENIVTESPSVLRR